MSTSTDGMHGMIGSGAGNYGNSGIGRKISQNLQYGADESNNSKHWVKFTAREHTGANTYLTGGAYTEEPENLKQNLTTPRAPMKTSKDSVKLYLPANISVSQKVNFGEAEMGGLVAAGVSAVSTFSGGTDGVLGNASAGAQAALSQVGTGVGDALARAGTGVMETLGATGATAAQQINSGVTKNNRTEMMFEGLDRRSFSFTFRLIPHSADEASTIQAIVQSFRFHMLPHVPAGTEFGRLLVAPSTYLIQYAHEKELHKIGECFLESVDVKYGGERPQFYHDNRPTETELTLQFKELEIMTKSKVMAGF